MGALDGVKVLEFGAGAAGPLTTRYLADHGATVVRVESRARPDFLRVYALTATQRSLDAAPMFAAFNCNKLAITLNMKHERARDVALRLVGWADVVAENFAPGAMARWALAYEDLVKVKPDIVMVSTCMHGQTGPERDYPGFGGQGAALSGFNHLTGWPDGEPLGPYGTITDSLSPRFAAAAMMAALIRRRRTGRGCHLDLSQVECAIYALGETIAERSASGRAPGRLGNADPHGAPLHGAFPCSGDDRWVAVACRDDGDLEALARFLGAAPTEENLSAWTAAQTREEAAEALRSAGLEAAPVQDLEDLWNDEQLRHRGHFVEMEHPVIRRHAYETLGFRLPDSPPSFTSPGPTLGRDNARVYRELLGMSAEEYEALETSGAFE